MPLLQMGYYIKESKMPTGLKIEVPLEQFTKKDQHEKLDLIYGAVVKQQNVCEDQCDENEDRFKIIENRKHLDKGFAGMMGFIGGFISGFINKL